MPTIEERNLIFSKLGYVPTEEQGAIHDSSARVRLVAGGERSGKSFSASMDFLGRFYEGSLYWLVAQDYERTKAEFNYICDGFEKLGIDYYATKKVDPGEIVVPGVLRIDTKSAKDPRKIAMEAPDGIVVCEASQIDYETFLRLRGRIAEKRGWMLLEGTFESSLGWYPELWGRGQLPNEDDLVSFSLPTWSNRRVYPGGRNDPEIKRLEAGCSPEWFMERYAGVPMPPRGRVFNEFGNKVHTGAGGLYDFDPGLEAFLFVDPGFQHAYAVEVAQKKGDQLVIVDEIYERGLITNDIILIAQQRPWWTKAQYGWIDVAATQHQGTLPVTQVWEQEGKKTLYSSKVMITDGIERTKNFLIVNPLTGKPKLLINSKCKGLISELGGCPSPLDGQTKVYSWKVDKENNVIGDIPADKYNDACKALAYGIVGMFGYAEYQRKTKVKFY